LLARTRRQIFGEGFVLVPAIDAESGVLAGFCFALTFGEGRLCIWSRRSRPLIWPI
jgi:hypothetical protein